MNIFKYYLTIFSHYFSRCNVPSGEGGGGLVPASCYNVVQSMLSLLTTDYQVHIRLNLERQHTPNTAPEFIKYLLDTTVSSGRRGRTRSSHISPYLWEEKNVCPVSWQSDMWYQGSIKNLHNISFFHLPSPVRKAVWVCNKYYKNQQEAKRKCFW